ncbi:hypothetical protein [Streptomyces sp. NPDC047928]|uniref:hypothetical protein n=1 Tax=unclassified Streptomyces TaxID=2593676 RepID=UPI00371B105D
MPNLTVLDRLATDPLVVAQDGLATVHQLMDLGCASSVVAERCRPAGPWRRVLPRVVHLRTDAPTPHQRLRAALLYAGPGALLTGEAALALHGVEAAPPLADLPKVDVLVARPVHPRSYGYVRIHRTHQRLTRVPVRDLACVPVPRAVRDAIPYLNDEAAMTALLAEVGQSV